MSGGTNNLGTVFKVDAANNYAISILANLNTSNVEAQGISVDSSNNLYGVISPKSVGVGTVFRMSALGNGYAAPTTVATFASNLQKPQSSAFVDPSGNIIGNEREIVGSKEVVYKLDNSADQGFSPLITTDNSNGLAFINPITDGTGKVYGVAAKATPSSEGSIFTLDPFNNYQMSTVADLPNSLGGSVVGVMTRDVAGNFFGYTTLNFIYSIYKLDASNGYAASIIATQPVAFPTPLITDSAGNIFGYGISGGSKGGGYVFELVAANNYQRSNIADFSLSDATTGSNVATSLIMDPSGAIYGATSQGGANGHGTFFVLTPDSVPEPASAVLLCGGSIAIVMRGARRGRRVGGENRADI